jgi:hypothetical protein
MAARFERRSRQAQWNGTLQYVVKMKLRELTNYFIPYIIYYKLKF